jgi:GAF domain-containing protein
MIPSTQYATAVASAARAIGSHSGLDETLRSIAEAASRSVPGFTHAGISTIDRHGVIETRAATDPLVRELDRIQYELGQGPCVSAMREQAVVSVPHARHDQRWPDYMPQALKHGLRSQLAVRLFLDDTGSMGGLNLYSTESEEIDPDAENIADLFAAHAAIALQKVGEIEHLNEALRSRQVIGQAIGIVMERYGVDNDAAFAFLLRASSHGNIKLRDVAERLVADTPRTAHG